ncbi:aldehyde ferredoxin oxidoreductase [bacterium]|nr:aldehyde ferredoxin oxidoreductase [candidate division CSSED10-310 bacterium]
MANELKVLLVDAGTGFYKLVRYPFGGFFGPVDLGLHLAGTHNSLNIGAGVLAGSIFPGSNRLVVTGFSPCWGGVYISSMGGAALVFDNLGINMLSIVGHASSPSVLVLNRRHAEEILVRVKPIDVRDCWASGRGGLYGLMETVLNRFGEEYTNDPRILATGPAALATDIGAIGSAPIKDGVISCADTWAGRGGFGSKLLKEHGIASIIYGGTFIDEDFRNRMVADSWFQDTYHKKLAAKDFEATTKYRFDPKVGSGGTFGVNFATLGGRLLFNNYRSIFMDESLRLKVHKELVLDHYLKQFNEETIVPKQQKTCGEPCAAVCKKLYGVFKKDYEPYQVMGPLCGVFDQRAAETLNHAADRYGFDAISIGGILAWLMEILDRKLLSPSELGVDAEPHLQMDGFDCTVDSKHNAELGVKLLDQIIQPGTTLDLSGGARKFARGLARSKGRDILDAFLYTAFGRNGWMVPNQYWTPGVLAPMPIMGKYYNHYGSEFIPPRELGRLNAQRFRAELVMDTLGVCRFHRAWAEEMLPEIVESLFGLKEDMQRAIAVTAGRINSRNASVFWESRRAVEFVKTFLLRARDAGGNNSPELAAWLVKFDKDADEAALEFWYEMHKGTHESLREF